MALNPWTEKTGEQIFGSSPFVQYLKDLFSTKTHTHSKTDISDFNNHTHTKEQISNFSHSHSISDVTNLQSSLNGKQNTIPNLSLISTQSMYGLTVNVYSDGLNVYLTIGGTLNGNSSLPVSGNRAKIGTLSNTNYAPPYEMQTTVHSASNWSRITVLSNGEIYLQNGTSSKSLELYGSFYYPLKSRIP